MEIYIRVCCLKPIKNFEWIIVDDGSTDDIDEIIKSYQNEDRILIRFIKQENGGKHRAINNGVLHAKGELFLYCR